MKSENTLRDAILATEDLAFEPVKVPEWNFTGFVRELDGEARFRLSTIADAAADGGNVHIIEAYVCEGLFDEKRERVFGFEDRAALAGKNPEIVQRLYRRILKVSRMDTGSVAEIEKKSERATA